MWQRLLLQILLCVDRLCIDIVSMSYDFAQIRIAFTLGLHRFCIDFMSIRIDFAKYSYRVRMICIDVAQCCIDFASNSYRVYVNFA